MITDQISVWCQAELAHMLARQQECRSRTQYLIIPAILHDGEDRPQSISDIPSSLCLEIQDCTSVRTALGSPRAEQLDVRIRSWVPTIVQAIRNAPEYNPEWIDSLANEFSQIFDQDDDDSDHPRQDRPPSF